MSSALTSETVAGIDALLSVLQEHGVTRFSGYGVDLDMPTQGKEMAPEKPIGHPGAPVHIPPAYRDLPAEFIPTFPGSGTPPPPPKAERAAPRTQALIDAGVGAVMDRAASLFVASGQQD